MCKKSLDRQKNKNLIIWHANVGYMTDDMLVKKIHDIMVEGLKRGGTL